MMLKMIDKVKYRILLVLVLLFATVIHESLGQIVVVPLPRNPENKISKTSKTESIDPIELPFWDDFSTVRSGYADEKLWEYGNSVWVNDGMGINPPSFNVATFDGLDSIGKPYNVNDVLAKGLADKMVSAPIRLDLVDAADRQRVYISFFYQFYGNGEPPDLGDYLYLSFKNNLGKWEEVWRIENNGTLEKDVFEEVNMPISDEKYFHESFQFKIQNFARLSGPYDTWHVDYIYISNGKLQSAPVRSLFPDRTITSKITTPFGGFWSMPVKHFFTNTIENYSQSTVQINNLRKDQVPGNGQPISYNSYATISNNKKNQPPVIVDVPLDNNTNIGSELAYGLPQTITFTTMPDPDLFDQNADSININLKIEFDTGDNKIKTATEGDYDFNVFSPIEFRSNDTISTSFILSNYYAYDDGSAEYGAGLNQPGSQLAYEFTMRTDQPDTIVAVDIYFPRFGDESNQVVLFQIWRELSDDPFDIIYQQSLPIQRSSQNKFLRVPLIDRPAGVINKFYIGWKQSSSATIAVGLDKNSDSGGKIFANINGAWEQNQTVRGNLMIRPIFGKGNGSGDVTAVEDFSPSVFPNPSSGIFYINGFASSLEVYNMNGKRIDFKKEMAVDKTQVTITDPEPGLYLLKYWLANKIEIKRILIR
jgi:hypothetical protein